jgi:hypothetical protein
MQSKINGIRQMLKRGGYIVSAQTIRNFIKDEQTPNRLIVEKIIYSGKFTHINYLDIKSIGSQSRTKIIEYLERGGYDNPTEKDIQSYVQFKMKYPKGVFNRSRIMSICDVPKQPRYTRKEIIQICQSLYPKMSLRMIYRYIAKYGVTYPDLLSILINVPQKYE